MNMIEAGYHHDLGVGNEGKDDEIPGRRSIERAIEESLGMKIKSSGFETKVVSTEEVTPKVADKLNLENQDTELEAYILDKLSLLQPSFRTLFEPSVVVGTSSTTGSNSDNKIGQEAVAGKSKWKKKFEDVIAKVTNTSWSAKKKQQSPDVEGILYETDVKGILKMRWEEERKKSRVKQRTRWPASCICCPRTNSTGKNMEEWEFQLEEYSSTW
ncbi:hypothetical protein REPUB_Repub15cG0080200 [Reevesia pubescens]